MKVAFDSWVLASRLRYQGSYVYAQNLIAQFKRIAPVHPEISFCLFASPQAANDANSIEPSGGFELSRTAWLARDRLWRLGGVSLAAARARADLIFSPTSNILPVGAVPVVCTIHDVTPVVMPSHSRKVTMLLRSLLWWSCRRSRAIITVSECSKKDLVRTYGLPESKISVVYNGYDDAIFNGSAPDAGRQKLLLDRIGVREGWRCLDAGAGAGAVTRMLADRVGMTGSVLATDLDTRLLEGLASEIVEVRRHNVLEDPLPQGAFDLVHARCLLMHLPSRLQVLNRLRGAVRSGGWIAILDKDFTEMDVSQPSGGWRRTFSAFSTPRSRPGGTHGTAPACGMTLRQRS